jgi:hypothetical protein
MVVTARRSPFCSRAHSRHPCSPQHSSWPNSNVLRPWLSPLFLLRVQTASFFFGHLSSFEHNPCSVRTHAVDPLVPRRNWRSWSMSHLDIIGLVLLCTRSGPSNTFMLAIANPNPSRSASRTHNVLLHGHLRWRDRMTLRTVGTWRPLRKDSVGFHCAGLVPHFLPF